jgi:hypothetical protein
VIVRLAGPKASSGTTKKRKTCSVEKRAFPAFVTPEKPGDRHESRQVGIKSGFKPVPVFPPGPQKEKNIRFFP